MKRILEVESCTNVAELSTPSQRWDDLDTAPAEAVVNIAKGPLERELFYREEMTRKGKLF